MNTQTNAGTTQRMYPAIRYGDAKGAIEWLTTVLGFETHVVYPGEGGSIAHAELTFGGNLIMLGSAKSDSYVKSPKEAGGVTSSIYIALDTPAEVDAAYARAKSAGARIARELEDMDYGSHEFSVTDPEGHWWSFGTYRPSR